jgi:hypothetical protein
MVTFLKTAFTNTTTLHIRMKWISFFILMIIVATACQKQQEVGVTPVRGDTILPPPPPGGGSSLSYGDSILYLSNTGSNIISPKPLNKKGVFIGFPKGIELDSANGNINLLESEMGLRYKIMFVPEGTKDTISTKVVLSGINFYDGIYNLSKGDTVAKPIYNANGLAYNPGLFGTGTNNVFDDGNGCNKEGCAVSFLNGSINLAQSLRNGAIASTHDAQKEFLYNYRMDDKSGKSVNKLKVKLYYYKSRADIPQYLWDILLTDHAGTILKSSSTLLKAQATARPRPPCIVIVAQ